MNAKLLVFSAAASLCASLGVASAATVTYTNVEPTPKIELVIDDGVGPDKFQFSLSTLIGTADFLALGFNFSGTSLSIDDFELVSATNASDASSNPTLQLFGNNTGSQNTCGTGCNFNGDGSATHFDYILRIGQTGGAGDNYVKSVVFNLATFGTLANNPFSQLAVRAQSTTNPGGSIKTDLTVVPLPAAGWLLIGGLGALAAVRRRKRAG